MTDTPLDISSHAQRTFSRNEHGTQVSETEWTFTGMRSLRASYPDGTHMISFITHRDEERRHTSLGAHNLVKIDIGSDDSLALDINVVSEDGTHLTVNLFGVTLSDLLEAVAKAVASKTTITEDSNA